MRQYAKCYAGQIILERFPKIWSTPIFLDHQEQLTIYPLKSWENRGGNLEWWNAYTQIKHTRHKNFVNATLKNTLDALGALLILEAYLYKLVYKTNNSARFGTSLLRFPGLAEAYYIPNGNLPDFEQP